VVGEKGYSSSWPWIVSIGFEAEDLAWIHRCAGSVVDKRIVSTVAHCVLQERLEKHGGKKGPSYFISGWR